MIAEYKLHDVILAAVTSAEYLIIIIIIHEFHRDASLEQNFRAD